MQFLDRVDQQIATVPESDRGGFGPPDRRKDRHPRGLPGEADHTRIADGFAFLIGGVDDQGDITILDHINNMRPTFDHLVDHTDRQPGFADRRRRETGRRP